MNDKKYGEDDLERFANIIFEKFEDKLAIVVENLDGRIQHYIKPLAADITELKTDIKIVKAVVTENSKDLHKLERRVTQIEASV